MSFELDQTREHLVTHMHREVHITTDTGNKICKSQAGKPQRWRFGRFKEASIPSITTKANNAFEDCTKQQQRLSKTEAGGSGVSLMIIYAAP